MQKYGATYVYRLYIAKIWLYLRNVFGKGIFRPCTLSRDAQRQKAGIPEPVHI